MKRHLKSNDNWVGKTDWKLNKFHGDEYSTHRGNSHNSCLLEEEKVVMIDTVRAPFSKEFDLKRIIIRNGILRRKNLRHFGYSQWKAAHVYRSPEAEVLKEAYEYGGNFARQPGEANKNINKGRCAL